jgi:UDP-3-O-[3-hydroxymyristoyl] N-acetylglucosamine deacetylase/3-hydroxyacyl-[acyl-carrier-protein] dehydratase
MSEKQTTLNESFSVEGIGLHTGKFIKMTFEPAPANHGFRFQRIDLDDQPILMADVSKVVSTNRGTTIKQGEVQVSTIEHSLSALLGMNVDNALIKIDGPEAPIMDGSALDFIKGIESAGVVELEKDREVFVIEETISYKDEVTGTELIAMPADKFEVTAMIDFNSKILGMQYASMEDIADYKEEIAPCRTFVFLHELEQLINQGLIKGGDLDNAIVIVDRMMNEEELANLAKRLGRSDVKVDKEGILNTVDLRFKNEPARHKLLDIIGDLALIGKRIQGKIVGRKPGHTSNIEFAKILKKVLQKQRKLKGKPHYDPNQEPLMNIEKIQSMLPHRFPFVMVDKILELTDTHVVGIKNITFNESFFQGHFPNNAVFPGVLQMEALAQTGGILALSTVPDPHNWDTYFIKIQSAKFKHKVVPGDTLLMKMELLSPIRRGICQMYGTIYVGNKIVSEGELIAQIVRRENAE